MDQLKWGHMYIPERAPVGELSSGGGHDEIHAEPVASTNKKPRINKKLKGIFDSSRLSSTLILAEKHRFL